MCCVAQYRCLQCEVSRFLGLSIKLADLSAVIFSIRLDLDMNHDD